MRDYSYDSIFTGDGTTFPYLNWALMGENGIDFTGDGTENNNFECIPADDFKIIYTYEK